MPTIVSVLKVLVFICLFHGKFRRYLKGMLSHADTNVFSK